MFVTPKTVRLTAAIDLKAARASQRVARPTARRPQPTLKVAIRRGCRVTAYIATVRANQRAPVITRSNSNHPPSNYSTGNFPGPFLTGSSLFAIFVLFVFFAGTCRFQFSRPDQFKGVKVINSQRRVLGILFLFPVHVASNLIQR